LKAAITKPACFLSGLGRHRGMPYAHNDIDDVLPGAYWLFHHFAIKFFKKPDHIFTNSFHRVDALLIFQYIARITGHPKTPVTNWSWA
jgi:hypothetical protein